MTSNQPYFITQRWLRARKVAWWLQCVPFLRLIGVSGSLARGEATQESDIDYLVIGQQGRLWTVRFFVTILTHLIGKRRHGEKIAGRICLNRYLADPYLLINPQNEYHARDYTKIVPLFDTGGVYQRYQATNSWMEKYYPFEKKVHVLVRSPFLNAMRRLGEKILKDKFGDFAENKLRNYQMRRIEKNPLTYKEGARIVVNDNELAFHPEAE